jgi:adenylosuccinate synthase
MPGWQKPTRGCKTFESLALEAQEYIEFLEQFVEVRAEFYRDRPRKGIIIRR